VLHLNTGIFSSSVQERPISWRAFYTLKIAFTAFTVLFLSYTSGFADPITLKWKANTEKYLAGYKIYYKVGSAPTQKKDPDASIIDIPKATLADEDQPEYTIADLDPEKIYFFALTAYDDAKHVKESKLSAGVSTLRITSPENGFYVNASNHTAYRITGKTAAGAVVEIFAAKTSLGKTTAGLDGNWQKDVDFSAIKEGSVDLTVESKGSISYPVSGILDISAPQLISQPWIKNKKDTFVIIEWKTDEAGAGVVEYGPDISYGFTKTDNNYTKNHAVLLTNLAANTNYHYRISSTDAAGNGPEASWTDHNPSDDKTFLTDPSTPPKIIEPPIIYRESNEIKLTFDEPNLQNTFVEANYNFSPSLNFFSLEESDDILQIDDFSYILRMGSIPEHEILVLRLSNIVDSLGNPVTPATITINDTDRDHMADDWERDYGLETSVNDGSEDWDEDGYTSLQEYRSRTDPRYSGSAPFRIKDAIPQNNAGIFTATRVLNDTSVAFLIESARGININELDSIRFTIDDGYHESYERDLSSDTVRVVKISDDDDHQIKQFWAVYDRSLETFMPDSYLFEAVVNVTINVRDVLENQMNTAVDNFRVESEEAHRVAQKNLPHTWDVDPADPDLDGVYDAGIEMIGGELAGARVIYSSSELQGIIKLNYGRFWVGTLKCLR
jgi:hypothetical protein